MIGTIFKIIYEIRYFILIVIIANFGFMNAYYLLGKNQLHFEKVPIGSHPLYSTIKGAFQYSFLLFGFTEAGLSNFTVSADKTNNMQVYLWVVFVLATFVLCLHLLNMLIGIMGDIQTQ